MPEATGGPGVCRFGCGRPVQGRGTAHPECKAEWRAWNVPAQVRRTVLQRDGYRCQSCGHVYPDRLLRVDHIVGVAEAWDEFDVNDPTNYSTKCEDHPKDAPGATCNCHGRKSAEASRARNGATSGRATTPKGREPMPAMTRPQGAPDWRGYARFASGATLTFGGVTAGALVLASRYAPAGQVAPWSLGALIAAVAGALTAYVWQVVAVKRADEDQRVYVALCRVTQDAADARALNFAARDRDGFTPVDVTLRYGERFEAALAADEDRPLAQLVAHFAHAIDAAPPEVQVVRRKGRVRLRRLDRSDEETQQAHPQADAADLWPDPDETQHEEARGNVTADIAEALLPVLDDAAVVTVEGWHDDKPLHPAVIVVSYRPRVASRANAAKAGLLTTIEDHYPSQRGRWAIEHDAPSHRYLLSDVDDPLTRPVPLPEIPDGFDLAAPVDMGLLGDGSKFRLPLLTDEGARHVLVAGASGSGKSSPIWSVIRWAAPGVKSRLVRLWLADPKGGMEFLVASELAPGRVAVKKGDIADLLIEARDCMHGKAEALAARGVDKLLPEDATPECPIDIVLIDEILGLVRRGSMDKAKHDEMLAAVEEMLVQGRATATIVLGATQKFQVDSLPFRDLFLTTLLLRANAAREVDMVLGQGMRAAGALADKISKDCPGTGYIAEDGAASVVRFRAPFFPKEARAAFCKEYAPAGREAPEHGTAVAGGVQTVLGEDACPQTAEGLAGGQRVRFDGDPDPVVVLDVGDDPDEPEARVLVTYRYDGEAGAREASFERGEPVEPVS